MKKAKDKSLDSFFDKMISKLRLNPFSQESKNQIYGISRFNICHIFPKRIYKSVSDDEMNIVFLTWEEHTLFDILLDNMEFDKIESKYPNVWKIILERFDYLDEKITEQDKNHIKKIKKYIHETKNINPE